MIPTFTDMHHHIAYGVDDGPQSPEAAFDMLRAAHDDHIGHLVATAHVTPGQEAFDLPDYLRRVDVLNRFCNQAGLAIRIWPGAEILYTGEAVERMLRAREIPTLADSRFVLLEFLPDDPYDTLQDAARRMTNAGYRPVFAHVERYACLVRDPRRVTELKSLFDVRIQVNCSCVLRKQSMRARKFIQAMLENGGADYIATDAHNCASRPCAMTPCYEALLDRLGSAAARALTGENQAEILAS